MRRFRAGRVVAFGGGGLLLLGVAFTFLTEAQWDGAVPVEFRIAVRDKATARPIAAGSVYFVEGDPNFWEFPRELRRTEAEVRARFATDGNGQVRFTEKVRASGTFNWLWRTGFTVPIHLALEVSAPGYQERLIPVGSLASDGKRLYKERIVQATVELQRADGQASTTTAKAEGR